MVHRGERGNSDMYISMISSHALLKYVHLELKLHHFHFKTLLILVNKQI